VEHRLLRPAKGLIGRLASSRVSKANRNFGEIKAAADEKLQGNYPGAPPYVRPKLRQALIDAAGDKGDINPKKLGQYLKQLDGAAFDDGKKKFVGERDIHAKQKKWKIIMLRQQQLDTGDAAPF
jgi:hypothetical protein